MDKVYTVAEHNAQVAAGVKDLGELLEAGAYLKRERRRWTLQRKGGGQLEEVVRLIPCQVIEFFGRSDAFNIASGAPSRRFPSCR